MNPELIEEWKVNPAFSTPLAKQLADNIRWTISTGKVKPGEKILSLRELSKELNISINTVRMAYKMLEDQQLIVTRPYHGTSVVNFIEKMSESSVEENSASKILARTIKMLENTGMSISEIRDLFNKMCDDIELNNSNKYKVLLVECSEFECSEFSRQIKNELNVTVDKILTHDLDSSIANSSIDITAYKAVITSYFHYASVMQSIRNFDVQVLGMVVDIPVETLNHIQAIPHGCKAGIICEPEHSLQYLINLISSKRKDIEILTAFSTDPPEKILSLIDNVESVFVTPTVKDKIRSITNEKPVFLFVDHINPQSIEMLRQCIQG